MPKSTLRKTMRNNMRRRRTTRGRQSEGLGRQASTNITIGVSISGNQGITFTPEQLLRNYFKDPRMIRIYRYRVRITTLDVSQPFLQFQAVHVMDTIDGPFVALTQPKQITLNRSTSSFSIARDRSFWIESIDEIHKILDLKFLALQPTKIIIEITTYFNIEVDLVNTLSDVVAVTPYDIKPAQSDFEILSPRPTTSSNQPMSNNQFVRR